MLALSFGSAADARSYGLDAGWWQFLIVNATAELRARLYRIHTDPRIVPLHIQYVLGQKRWAVKMLEALPNLNHLDPESIPETLTHYVMVILLDYLDSTISYLYGGSATGMSPGDHGSVALRHRIGNQHESMISAPNKQAFWACSGKAWYQAGGALGPGRPDGVRPIPGTV
jgi:hypothetical protein